MLKITKDILDFTEDGFKIETVKFSGFVGEPLVNPATIDGLEKIISDGRRTGLFTNGMFMDNQTNEGRKYFEIYFLQSDYEG